MHTESERLTRLVQQIIELSRLQGDDPLDEPVAVEVDKIIARAIDENLTDADARQIELVHDGTEGLVVLGNREQVAVAVGNLVANAVAYSPEGSSVVVSATARDLSVDLSVTDQGIGIPASRARPDLRAVLPRRPRPAPLHRRHRPRPLDRQARRRLPRRRGAGVVGRGPGLDLHPQPAPQARRTGHPAPLRCDADRGEQHPVTRVLVVEDEESYSDALAYLLRKEGFEVAIAATGPDALTEFERGGADIVLLDLMLPGIPGTEVCRQIRQTSNVPVIMVSAKDDEVDKVVGLELGADDYVTKPYSPRELVARIRAVLRRGVEPDLAPATLEVGRRADGRRPPPRHPRRRTRCGCRSRSSSCSRCSCATPAAC